MRIAAGMGTQATTAAVGLDHERLSGESARKQRLPTRSSLRPSARMPAMRLPRPKSLSSLMLIGFALVSVPLLLAVVDRGDQGPRLSEESAALVRRAWRHTRYHAAAVPADRLDRAQRQALPGAERPRELLEVYRDSRERLLVTLEQHRTRCGATGAAHAARGAAAPAEASRSGSVLQLASATARPEITRRGRAIHRCGKRRRELAAASRRADRDRRCRGCRPRLRDAAVSVLAVGGADPAHADRWSSSSRCC